MGGSALGAVSAIGAGSLTVFGQVATPGATPFAGATPVAGGQEFLAVADPEAELLYVYGLPDLALIDMIQ